MMGYAEFIKRLFAVIINVKNSKGVYIMAVVLYTNKHRHCAICEYWAGGNIAIKPRMIAGSYELVAGTAKGQCRHPMGRNAFRPAMGSCEHFELRGHLH